MNQGQTDLLNRNLNKDKKCKECNLDVDYKSKKSDLCKKCKCFKNKKCNRCVKCNSIIRNEFKMCKSCFVHPTKINWPSDDELIEMCKNNTKVYVGKILGVSDNAVNKRIKKIMNKKCVE